MRWLLLDEVLVIRKGESARSRSRIPAEAVSPEALLIEMMAQTGAVLLGAEDDFSKDMVFAKIQEANFSGALKPGEPIEIEVSAEDVRPEGAWINAKVKSAGEVLATARLMLVIVGHLITGRTKPVTFHDNFMDHFKIRNKVQ